MTYAKVSERERETERQRERAFGKVRTPKPNKTRSGALLFHAP